MSPSEKMPAAAIRKLAQERTASSVTIIIQCYVVPDDVSVVKNRLHCDFYLDFAVGIV